MANALLVGSQDRSRAGWYLHYSQGGRVGALSYKRSKMAGVGSGSRRGRCRRFTGKSRLRLLDKVAGVDSGTHDVRRWLFITLTYPGQWRWPENPAEWKRHLDTWVKRLEREFGKWCVFWKLEPQRRGAPHFHLIVIPGKGDQVPDDFRFWLSRSWYEVVGSGELNHLKAGTNVQRVRTYGGAVSYAAKYVGKVSDFVDEETGELREVGRFWGVRNYDAVMAPVKQFRLCDGAAYSARRILRRCLRLRAYGRFQGLRAYLSTEGFERLVSHLGEGAQEWGWLLTYAKMKGEVERDDGL